jgi:hypothetical protein
MLLSVIDCERQVAIMYTQWLHFNIKTVGQMCSISTGTELMEPRRSYRFIFSRFCVI